MDGRAFLLVADNLAKATTEAEWRTAVGRAYYGLLLEGREVLHRWGFATPPRDKVHSFVRLRFIYCQDGDLSNVGTILESLSRLRNRADYEVAHRGPFTGSHVSRAAVSEARKGIAILDMVNLDASRKAAAIADIRQRWK